MKLIKKLNAQPVVETAAVGVVSAGTIAISGTPLFAQMVRRTKPTAAPVEEPIQKPKTKKITKDTKLNEAFSIVAEDLANPDEGTSSTNNFDRDNLITKLKGLEKRETKDNRNTVTFGLQDDNGGLIRVVVQSDEAEDFERALESFLLDREGTDEDIPEIAEILFQLKDQFNIIDVEWPEISEDEEQEAQLNGNGGGNPGGQDATDPSSGGDLDLDPNAGMSGADDGQVQDLLTQVIDMMRADAEARKAEARAKEAEAKAKEADAIVAQSLSRVKQEEQYLDMETYNKARKDEEREAKRLAQLARFKHDMGSRGDEGGDDEDFEPLSLSSPEEEETQRAPGVSKLRPTTKTLKAPRGRLRPHDIAQYILGRVK